MKIRGIINRFLKRNKEVEMDFEPEVLNYNYTIDEISLIRELEEDTYELTNGGEVIEKETVQTFVVEIVLNGYSYYVEFQRSGSENWSMEVHGAFNPLIREDALDKLKNDILNHPKIRMKLLFAGSESGDQ